MTGRPHFADSDELLRHVREVSGDTVILAFSTGKDAIASWLQLRRHGFKVRPFFQFLIPGLGFVDESLAYYERFFGEKILRIPSPALFRMLRASVFQKPHRSALLVEMAATGGLPSLSLEMIDSSVREAFGAPDAWIGIGTRGADSPLRAATLRRYGPTNPRRRTFAPIYDWDRARVIAEIKAAGVKLPVDYRMFGSSFDGIDFKYLEPLRRHRPDDYARILRWLPLAEMELLRREYAARRRAKGVPDGR